MKAASRRTEPDTIAAPGNTKSPTGGEAEPRMTGKN